MRGLIVGNWKMHGSVSETLKLITEISHRLERQAAADVVVAPPFTALYSAQIVLQETTFKLAAQDAHWEQEGAFTGEVSPGFLKEIGCEYVILGHSERRRHFGENDEMIGKKIEAALRAELIPIFCVGETDQERQEKLTETVLERQIQKGLTGLGMNDLKGMVIAYEPVWAIGTGKTASPDQIGLAHQFIRTYLAKKYDAPTANQVRILYGGSVNPENAGKILDVSHVDGLLVGGASLSAEQFVKIIRQAESKES